jgi:3D (Asp-Asp-Asp) domain-containing protein
MVILIGATIICTSINVYADHKLQQSLEDVKQQQTDTLNTLMYHRISTEPELNEIVEPELVSLGQFKITHYCSCSKCCGNSNGITATGTVATAGRTIGVDPNVIPLGSTVYINGQAFVAEDTGGGIKGNRIDMFVDSHQEAIEKGVYTAEVFMEV